MLNKLKHAVLVLGGSAALACLLVLSLSPGSGPMRIIAFASLTVAISLVAYFALARYDRQLSARISNPGAQEWEWLVLINGASLGTVTDAQYATILRKVLRDGDVAFDQSLQLLRWLVSAAGKTVVATPAIFFWFLALSATVSTAEEAMPLLRSLLSPPEAALLQHDALIRLIWTTATAAFLVIVIFVPRRALDCHEREVHRQLRRHFETPVIGDVRVFCMPTRANAAAHDYNHRRPG